MKNPWIFVSAFLWVSALGAFFGIEAFANDARVQIVSPKEGQIFAPGDKVSIAVEVAPSLHATDGKIGIFGLGSVHGTGFSSTRITAAFEIPEFYAGQLTLQPEVWAGGTVLGPKTSVKVRPRTPAKRLEALNRYFSLDLGGRKKLYFKGLYANGIKRDLTSSAAGTTYKSSNPLIVSVDSEGSCTAIAKGLAVITVENKGVHDFAVFVVDDAAHPSPPIDLSDQVAIRLGKMRLETNPRVVRSHYQQVTIANTSSLPLAGPLFIAISGLPKGVILYGGDGEGRFVLTLPDQGLGLLPGQHVTVDLEFLNQGNAAIVYGTKIYHGVH